MESQVNGTSWTKPNQTSLTTTRFGKPHRHRPRRHRPRRHLRSMSPMKWKVNIIFNFNLIYSSSKYGNVAFIAIFWVHLFIVVKKLSRLFMSHNNKHLIYLSGSLMLYCHFWVHLLIVVKELEGILLAVWHVSPSFHLQVLWFVPRIVHRSSRLVAADVRPPLVCCQVRRGSKKLPAE